MLEARLNLKIIKTETLKKLRFKIELKQKLKLNNIFEGKIILDDEELKRFEDRGV